MYKLIIFVITGGRETKRQGINIDYTLTSKKDYDTLDTLPTNTPTNLVWRL